jgi:DMSO/TMAO reductase YedYZ molybdopterin-dependent catalytic subunit
MSRPGVEITPGTAPRGPSFREGMTGLRRRAGVSGAVAVAVALGVGELLAGVFDRVASPLASVGSQVVDRVPPFVEDFAIGLFGTADKAALAIGTVIIALAIGWFVGVASLRRPAVGVAAFVVFGALGVVTGLAEPLIAAPAVVAAVSVAAASGIVALRVLLRSAQAETPTDGVPADGGRRLFIGRASAGIAVAVVAGGAGRMLLARVPETSRVAVDPGVTIPQMPEITPGQDFGLPGLTPIVVPNRDFFRIDTALVVPRIDAASWRLRVHGMVEREVTVGYDDLLGMDLIDRFVTIACVSNEVGGDLVGNAYWTGVRLTDVLDRAGVDPAATQLVGRSVDRWTAGFPTELAYDGREAMIAVAMNGEPLPRQHGYPARLIVPGLYGYVSATKWLTEIELTRWEDFDAYWVPRGWSKEGPIKTQSRIDVPRRGESVAAGPVTVAGVAFAPGTGIDGVELRVDEGPWLPAEISDPLAATAWVQWKAVLDIAAGPRSITVRATDGTGYTQTDERRPPRPDGATGHHSVEVAVV